MEKRERTRLTVTLPLLLTIFLASFPNSNTRAQESSVSVPTGLGARAAGLGGAYLAVAEDFTALYYNPAGLAQIRRVELYGDLSRSKMENETRFYKTTETDALSSTRLSSAGVVVPYPTYRGSLVFAAGLVRPSSLDFAMGVRGYDPEERFDKRGAVLERGWLGAYSFGFAVDVAPAVSLGAAANLHRGLDTYEESSTFFDRPSDAHADTVSLFAKRRFRDSYRGLGLTLGSLVKAGSAVRIGATIESPVTLTVQSTYEDEFRDEYTGHVDTFAPSGFSYSYKLRHPFVLGLGVSVRPHNRLLVSGAVRTAAWSQTEYVEQSPPAGGDVSDIPIRVEDFRRQYRDEISYQAGAEFLVPVVDLLLRAGFFTTPALFTGPRHLPEDESMPNPGITVLHRGHSVTVGAGLLVGQVLDVNLALSAGREEIREGSRVEARRTTRVLWSSAYRF